MKRAAITIALAAFASLASAACERITVEAAPFSYVEQDVPFATLSKIAKSRATFGGLFTRSNATLHGCKLVLEHTDAVLYVASELRADQCAYNRIRDHELRHVEVIRRHYLDIAQRVERRIPAVGLENAINEAFDAIQAEHRTLDTREEYAGNERACDNAIPKLTLGRPNF